MCNRKITIKYRYINQAFTLNSQSSVCVETEKYSEIYLFGAYVCINESALQNALRCCALIRPAIFPEFVG